MVILDVGCGQKKLPGAIGLDFSNMSDADICLNLNTDNLPFDDNSVDYVYSSHCLEHLSTDGFMHVLSEIYRVLSSDGSFFLTVPYFQTSANFANPFHNNNICFNEHTFRFFSSAKETNALSSEDYATPSCPQWGLRYSANSELNIEFNLEYLNYSYFSDYVNQSEAEKRTARQEKLNVVDSISFLLKPVKPAPQNKHTAPIETGDPLSFIKEQYSYFKEQVSFIENNNVTVEFDKNLLNIEVLPSGLVSYSKVYLPAYEIISVFNEEIQKLQKVIDKFLLNKSI